MPIIVGNNATGIAVDSNKNLVYVANSGDNTVSVIDGTDNKIIKNITVGKLPTKIAINPKNNEVYVANRGDNTVSVINGTETRYKNSYRWK